MSSQLYEILMIINKLCVVYVIVPYITRQVCNHYRIKKIYDHKKIIKVSVPPQCKQKYDGIVLNKIDNQEFREAILEFSKVLVEHFPSETLTNFYNNINGLKIKNNKVIGLIGAVGCYSSLSNSITLSDSSSIYHELFHMASRSYGKQDGILYTGFKQRNIKISKIFYNTIGQGLNEGYTEVLTHRYFGNKSYTSYVFETEIAKKLEIIIGSDKMTELYLMGDLFGLIDELKKYMSEDDIIKFITRLDLINGNNYGDNYRLRKIIVRESIFDLYEFLLKTYALKLKKQYEEGLINLNDFETLSSDYLKSFKDQIYGYELRNIYEMYKNILKDINAPEYIIKGSSR